MKKILLFTLLFALTPLFAGHKEETNEWQKTTLSDASIDHIQKAKYKYNQCISTEIKKVMTVSMDSRKATDIVMKQCEPVLTDVRQIFINEKVPERIALRYMKQIRTQTARKTLKQLMFVDASKKMGQPIK